MTPKSREEMYLNAIIENEEAVPTPIARIELFLQKIFEGESDVPTPVTRTELFLSKIAGNNVEIPTPKTRVEMYLAKIAGEDIEVPAPKTRIEWFLNEWANGASTRVLTTVTGTTPLTLANAIASSIKSLVQYGKVSAINGEMYCNNGKLVAVDDELPSGYKRITGIKFDGDFWYDTGEVLNGDDVVTMTLANTASSGQNVFGSYNGTGSGAKNFSLYIYGGGSSSNCYFRYGSQLVLPRFGSNEHTITFGRDGTSGFDVDVNVTPDEFTTIASAYIGMLPNSSSAAYTGSIIGDITVGTRLKWIPCERVSDGMIGYYEVVNSTFLEPVGTGTPVAGSYDTSHQNVLAVEGTSEVLTVMGKNLFDGTFSQGYWAYADGAWTDDAHWIATEKIPCKPSTYYTASVDARITRWQGYVWYDSNGDFISTTNSKKYQNVGYSAQSPANAAYLIFNIAGETSVQSTISPSDVTHFQIEEGSAATAYEPYHTPQTAFVATLLAVDDIKDEHDIISGTVTRRTAVSVSGGVITVSALASPVIEHVTAQPMQTTEGNNTVAATSEIGNVDLSVQYYVPKSE